MNRSVRAMFPFNRRYWLSDAPVSSPLFTSVWGTCSHHHCDAPLELPLSFMWRTCGMKITSNDAFRAEAACRHRAWGEALVEGAAAGARDHDAAVTAHATGRARQGIQSAVALPTNLTRPRLTYCEFGFSYISVSRCDQFLRKPGEGLNWKLCETIYGVIIVP